MSDAAPQPTPSPKHYFVDEAGDPVLFSARGKLIVGLEGCSRHFLLGLLDVPEPDPLGRKLDDLRTRLLVDPYFCGVPSMSASERKTAVAFHAKDDLPEVRREVFTLLRDQPGLRFFAVVRDKAAVAASVRDRNLRDAVYRYRPDELYDLTVRRLVESHLHLDGEVRLCFARRGTAHRSAALQEALNRARADFDAAHQPPSATRFVVTVSTPDKAPGLQAADYFLWALQRLFERGEDRYVEYLWPAFRLVRDLDDLSESVDGLTYTQRRPLRAKRPQKDAGDIESDRPKPDELHG